ncbi:septal ring lytic transglycosylase RlpA family protein [Dankookia sp. P2]|uniref:septal ring lytic transglycosylase RlpA family protein n=1 Tax=Dankookia sp. P2 TaxID=3423955 RepID=UPI003D66CAE4
MHRLAAPALLLLGLAACSTPPAEPPRPEAAAPPAQRGEASFYGPGFEGKRTASGERFDPDANTAASKTLPLGSVAEVTNLETGQSQRVRITDRGPYVKGRVVDVTPKVAEKIGLKHKGTAPVEVKPVAAPTETAAR